MGNFKTPHSKWLKIQRSIRKKLSITVLITFKIVQNNLIAGGLRMKIPFIFLTTHAVEYFANRQITVWTTLLDEILEKYVNVLNY